MRLDRDILEAIFFNYKIVTFKKSIILLGFKADEYDYNFCSGIFCENL